MLLILFDIILFIFRIIFNLLKFIIKITIGILAFILTKSFLRFPFLLFTIGFLLHINFNTLATIYFLYLAHLCALKFNIYNKIYIDLSYCFNKLHNCHKVYHCLKSLKNESIVLNNLHLEDNDEESCYIDDLVITNSCVFIIKTLNYPYDDFLKTKYFNKDKLNNESLNNDYVLDNNILNKLSNECIKCYNILSAILSFDIPITNVIALPQDKFVVAQTKDINTSIVNAKDLPYFIKNNISKNNKYSPLEIKELLLQNKSWSFDIVFNKLFNFINHSKLIILFTLTFIIFYYIYITFVTYIFFKLVRSL